MQLTRKEVAELITSAIEKRSCYVKDGVVYGGLARGECKVYAETALEALGRAGVLLLVDEGDVQKKSDANKFLKDLLTKEGV